MKIIAEFTVIPIGVGLSFSKYIVECEQIFQKAGLKIQMHPEGTNIEGEFEAVMAAIKQCIDAIHGMGAQRLVADIRINTRTDRQQTMEEKIESVAEKM